MERKCEFSAELSDILRPYNNNYGWVLSRQFFKSTAFFHSSIFDLVLNFAAHLSLFVLALLPPRQPC